MIYLMHFNRDYSESTVAKASRAEALRAIADAFELESHVLPDSPLFWKQVAEQYEAAGWKGFTFQMLNPETLELTNLAGTSADPFAHVESETLRAVLHGNDTMRDVESALEQTAKACAPDAKNRADYLKAREALEVEGDEIAAIEALRVYWSA